MNTKNLILTDDYFCNHDMCADCYDHVLDSIKMADALVDIGGKQFIDFPKYDNHVSDFLNELRNKAQETGSLKDAYDYVCVSADFFDTRHEFINHLGVKYSKNDPDQTSEFKRLYDISAPGYKNLADHVAHSHKLLFRSEPTTADLNDPEDSNQKNSDNK